MAYKFTPHAIIKARQARNSRRELKRKLLLIGLLGLVSSAIQDHVPMGGTILSGMGALGRVLSHQSLIERLPRGSPTSQPDGDIFSAEVSSSLMALACDKMAKMNQHTNVKYGRKKFHVLYYLFHN